MTKYPWAGRLFAGKEQSLPFPCRYCREITISNSRTQEVCKKLACQEKHKQDLAEAKRLRNLRVGR